MRGSHAVLNRKVFRWDDPFRDTHFPPNGWQCRCYVRSLDDDDLEEKGLKVIDSRDLKTREDKSAGGYTKLTYIIDGKNAATADGWNYNPGKVNQQIDSVVKEKTEGYDPELRRQVKASLKKEEEPKPAAPKQPSAASSQPAKPSEPAKQAKPEKKAVPKSAADKTEEPKASGKPEAKPAVPSAKPEAAAPKSAQQTVKDSNVPVKSTAAVPKPAQPAVKPAAAPKPKQADGAHGEPKPAAAPKPAQPAVKPAAAPKPKQADGAHGEPKPAAAPKPIKPAPAPANKPDAPRIIKPIKPADPTAHRVIKPIEPIDPSVHRVVEPVKPEAKQSILQTIRGKVSRAVDRVLSWLDVSSKWSSFEALVNKGVQGTHYANRQTKVSMPTAANNATAVQSKQQKLREAPKWADSKQMTQLIAKTANLEEKSIEQLKTEAQVNHQVKTASVRSFEQLSNLAENDLSTEQPQQININKGLVAQDVDHYIQKLKEDGNCPTVKYDENPAPKYLGTNIITVAFYNPDYGSVEEVQGIIHNKTREHAIIFNKANKCLAENVGNEDNVALNFKYQGEPYLVIHNHPLGNIFSPADISWAIDSGIHELRVLCKEDGIYAFYPGMCLQKTSNIISYLQNIINDAAASQDVQDDSYLKMIVASIQDNKQKGYNLNAKEIYTVFTNCAMKKYDMINPPSDDETSPNYKKNPERMMRRREFVKVLVSKYFPGIKKNN